MSFAFIRNLWPSLRWQLRRPDPRHQLGLRGERAAARFLKRCRIRIIARNYRCEEGEIDLICDDRGTLAFVEVKTRSSDKAQDPQEATRSSQWNRVRAAAQYFVSKYARRDPPCRFDLVTVVWPKHGSPTVEHFPDAYQPAYK